MNSLSLIVEGSFSMRLTITLLHFLWQGCLGGMLVFAGPYLLRDSARSRYIWNLGVMLSMAACFPATYWLQASFVDDSMGHVVSVDSSLGSLPGVEQMRQINPVNTDTMTARHFPALDTTNLSAAPSRLIVQKNGVLEDVSRWIALGYLTGMILVLGRLIRGIWCGHRLRSLSHPVTDLCILETIGRLARRLEFQEIPAVSWSVHIAVPVVAGVMKPMILLPVSMMSGLTASQLEALLLHELSHIRSLDPAFHLLQRVVEALLFFHPAVWYVSWRVSVERENAADDAVLSTGWDRSRYADALIRMAELATSVTGVNTSHVATSLGVAGPNPTDFKVRVLRLLEDSQPPIPFPSRLGLALTLLLLIMGGSLAWSQGERGVKPGNSNSERVNKSPIEASPKTKVTAENADVASAPLETPREREPNEKQLVQRCIQFLKSEQLKDGNWPEPESMRGGVTSLALCALLQSGVPVDDTAVQRGLKVIREVKPSKVYVASLQVMACCLADPKAHEDLIRRNVTLLVDSQNHLKGGWGYGVDQPSRFDGDGSNSRFAVLALHQAADAGFEVPNDAWRRIRLYWIAGRVHNGGWGYTPKGNPTKTMTLAGVASLAIVRRHLKLTETEATEQDEAIRDAIMWLKNHITLIDRESWPLYRAHALERMANLQGIDQIGSHEWRKELVDLLWKLQRHDGAFVGDSQESPVIATSLALMSLNRNKSIEKPKLPRN